MNDELTNPLDDEKEPSLLKKFAECLWDWARSHDGYEWFFIIVFGVPLTCLALMLLGAIGLEFVSEAGWFAPLILTAFMFVVVGDNGAGLTTAKDIFWGGILFSIGLMVLSALGVSLIALVRWAAIGVA